MQKNYYDPVRIEKKWQKIWLETKSFKSEMENDKTKFYILDMFPYPSGAGLHVGHVTGYTGTDIIARYKRQLGFNVLHPMGWDSFGLPAEQYAIRTGTHPAKTTAKNIETYRNQLQMLGFSYDWDREIATSDATYYKWTQFLFTKFFELGLAYEADIFVNFCPALGTVLANEEVEDGKSKEGGYAVEKRPLRQWVLKITAYADRLLDDLQELDWPDSLKKLQVNWIGKSEGAMIDFKVKGTGLNVSVFTTRPDTIYGVSFIALAPEHPLASGLLAGGRKEAATLYIKEAASKSDLERTDLAKEKTGVFTGSYAIHPITGKEIPIWVADFVLTGYGTGAVMAVPGHDERDFEFAGKFRLPVTCVIKPNIEESEEKTEILEGVRCWTQDGELINSAAEKLSINGLGVEEAKDRVIKFLEKEGCGKKAVSYKLRDWLFSRQRYWGEPIPILHFADGSKRSLELDELPLLPPPLTDYSPSCNGESPLAKVPEWVEIIDPKTSKKALRETNTMPQWAGSCWYYLRFCDPHNQKQAWSTAAENYWLPVDLYVGGAEHAVLHLLYARFWHKVFYDLGLVKTKEPFKTYRYQGLVTAPSYKRKGGGYVAASDVVQKEGKYYCAKTGEELLYQIEKMSKSKLNGVAPDEMVQEFGADSLRLYEMFMGPFDKEKIWNTDAAAGCKRFLTRFYDMVISDKVCLEDSEEGLKLGFRLAKSVREDIEAMQFNTAIAKMMEFINAFTKLDKYPKRALKIAVQALYPFAPHIAEELWEYLGESNLTYAPLMKIEEKYLFDEIITYVVQVNGKFRGSFKLPLDMPKEELLSFAKKQPQIERHLSGPLLNVFFVPNKLLNIVVGS